ncbi:MAG: hypothetical protein JNM00_00400 [Flavobacteriales bacterium]|nr:hypothetical protein [Flavobacteriales bacterium]
MKRSYIIGIAGGSGSGKTTFLNQLMSHFGPEQVALVSQDNYYKPKGLQEADANGVLNFDLPTSIDRAHFYNDMMALASGDAIEKLEYNFNNPAKEPQHIIIHPAPVIIMEGLFTFWYDEIRQHLDYKVYIEADGDERLRRRIERDGKERGYGEKEVIYQWEHHVRPAEKQFLEPFKSRCNLVVDNTHSMEDGLNELVKVITEIVEAPPQSA